MLFYEVWLCVQQPSSCCSNVSCCSAHLREVRGTKDSAGVLHLLYSQNVAACGTERGVPTGLTVRQRSWWAGGPDLLLRFWLSRLPLRVLRKHSMENVWVWVLHQYSKKLL